MRHRIGPRAALFVGDQRHGRNFARAIHKSEMLERVARSCPAHNTLVHGAEVDVDIETPMAAAASA